MYIAYIVTAAVLAVLLTASGTLLLIREQGVTETMTGLGVPLAWFPFLATAKYAGALGLLAGIGYRPLGVAASIGLVLYFAGAVVIHIRAKDLKGITVPAVLTIIAGVPLLLGLATL